jgi:8-oxo-dGTP pyrophosphatase MutT (NUDIX family)
VSGATEDLDIRDSVERWPVTSSAMLADGSLVRLRRDMVRMPDGEEVGRDVLEHPGAVAILALDERDQVLMIRQYRHAVGRLLWEIPAGLRDVAGEPLHVTAQRELLEEAGYRAARWQVLTDTFTSPGISTERLRIFLARGLALDERDQVLMIRQYRHAVGRLLWEIPAGLRDVAGEPLHVTAERELLEEAGYRAARWQVLTDTFTSPGISTERLRIFLARGLALVPEAERGYVREHEEAHLVVAWVSLQEAMERIFAGELHNGVTALGILSAYAARRDGFGALRDADAPER